MWNPASPCLTWTLLIAAVISFPPVLRAQEYQAPATQAQPAATQDSESLADAARKNKEEKDKPKARRVYDDENMPSRAGPVSVVGQESSELASSNGQDPSVQPVAAGEDRPEKRDQAYWRVRYQRLSWQIVAVDKQIADKQKEIEKGGTGGTSTDLSKQTCRRTPSGQTSCFAPVVDRVGQLKKLENRKAELEKQMDQLREEARKAGAEPGWLR